ncbi:hypothetical protein AAC387_Pa07g0474 [Persea americana]
MRHSTSAKDDEESHPNRDPTVSAAQHKPGIIKRLAAVPARLGHSASDLLQGAHRSKARGGEWVQNSRRRPRFTHRVSVIRDNGYKTADGDHGSRTGSQSLEIMGTKLQTETTVHAPGLGRWRMSQS